MKSPVIRIAIVDDHPVVLEGLSAALAQYPNIKVVCTAADLKAGMELVDRGGFDLLVTDLYLSEVRSGLDLMRYARKKMAGCKVVVLSYSHFPDDIFDANQAGADAYLVKDSDLDEIAGAISIIRDGGRPPLKPEIEAILWKRLQQTPRDKLPMDFSEREWEVLRLMSSGATNEEIAAKLFLSPRVVRRANTAIYRKLGVRNRAEAIACAIQEKWFKNP